MQILFFILQIFGQKNKDLKKSLNSQNNKINYFSSYFPFYLHGASVQKMFHH